MSSVLQHYQLFTSTSTATRTNDNLQITTGSTSTRSFIWVNEDNYQWFRPTWWNNEPWHGDLNATGAHLTTQFAPYFETDERVLAKHIQRMKDDPEYRRRQLEAGERLRDMTEATPFANFWEGIAEAIADERASKLLSDYIGAKRFDAIMKYDMLFCPSKIIPSLYYRVRAQGDIEAYERAKFLGTFCIHPSHSHDIPIPDSILLKWMMLQCEEEEFLKVANFSPVVENALVQEIRSRRASSGDEGRQDQVHIELATPALAVS